MARTCALLLGASLALACSGGEEPPPKAASPGAEAEEEGPPSEREWWAAARSLGTAPAEQDPEDLQAPVSCQLAGGSRFMRRGDCLAQGGRPEAR